LEKESAVGCPWEGKYGRLPHAARFHNVIDPYEYEIDTS